MRKFNRSFIAALILLAILILGSCQNLPTVIVPPAPAAEARLLFTIVAVSQLDTTEGHRLALNGTGTFNPLNVADVEGGGSFVQFDMAAEGVPKPLVGLATGTWKVKQGVKFTPHGDTYGTLTPGVLDLVVELVPEEGEVTEATLRLICNVGPAGLINVEGGTPLPEGYILTVPGLGIFEPIISEEPGVPPFGLSWIGPVIP
jgi:hypothetical protein